MSNILQNFLNYRVSHEEWNPKSTKIIAFFKSLLYCALCGRKFGEKCWSALKQKYYTVKRVWDHCHYLAASTFPAYASNLRAVLCQVERMRITDVRTDEWAHPLKKIKKRSHLISYIFRDAILQILLIDITQDLR